MEEDMEVLKNGLKATKKNRRGNQEIRFEVNSNYYKALENLIARYKELKQKYNNKLVSIQKEREEYEKNYIPKSKVKEKIEELDKRELMQEIDYYEYKYSTKVLQSLLED